MVVKVYISGISGNKEVKKRQQRVLLILDSKNIPYEIIDIAEPGAEDAKDFMQTNSTSLGSTIGDPNPRHPLPPQIFNDDDYCGDYDAFDMANEIDEMEKFLKVESAESLAPQPEPKISNGEVALEEKPSVEEESNANVNGGNSEEQETAVKEENVGDTAKTEEEKEEKKEDDEPSQDTKEEEEGSQPEAEKEDEKPENEQDNETEKAEEEA